MGSEVEGSERIGAAMALVGQQRWAEAADAFEAAAVAADAGGRGSLRVQARVGQANCWSEVGRLKDAASLLTSLRHDVGVESPLWVSVTANLAVCLARGGDVDQAEQLWRACFRRYLEAGEPIDAAQCLLNAGVAVHERGRESRALQLVGGARSILAQVQDAPAGLIAYCDATAGRVLSSMGEWDAARDALTAAVDVFTAAGRDDDAGRCHGDLAILALRTDRAEDARSHAQLAGRLLAGTDSPGDRFALGCLVISIAVADGDDDLALRLSGDAADDAIARGNALDIADALHNLAVVQETHGLLERAHSTAAAAFERIDWYRFQARSVQDRHSLTTNRFEPILLHALNLACRCAPPEDAAVLIERARVAGTPQGNVRPDEVLGGFADTSAPHLFGDGPLSPDLIFPLQAPGPLLLQRSEQRSPSGSVTFLADLIESSAGPGAWWWGTWAQRGQLFWAVRDPYGRVRCGVTTLTAEVLDLACNLVPVPTPFERQAVRASPGHATAQGWPWTAAMARVLAGPMMFRPDRARATYRLLPQHLRAEVGAAPAVTFENAMAALGDAVIPGPLAEALANSGERTLRLVVSIAPGLSWLPLPTLTVPSESGRRRFLVDDATLSLAPPWPVARHLAQAQGRSSTRPPARVGLSVADPLGDLRHVRQASIAADRTLGWGMEPRDAATVDVLRNALADLPDDSAFVYQGHAELADPSEPLSASFVLPSSARDRTPTHLSAHQILTDSRPWKFPHTVFLEGCETTGTWGSVEWEGLVPAMLQRGARQVVSTLWPVIDAPDATEVTRAVVDNLLQSGDAAEAVCQTQRSFLRRWRQDRSGVAPHHFAAHVATGTFPSRPERPS